MDISKIASELSTPEISRADILHIIQTEFSFVRKIIAQGEFKNIMLPKFGKFAVKPHRKKLLFSKFNDCQYEPLKAE